MFYFFWAPGTPAEFRSIPYSRIIITPSFDLLSSTPSMPNCIWYWHGIRSVAPARLTQTAGALERTIVGTPPPNIIGANLLRAQRDLVAESLLQLTVSLERPTSYRSDLMENVPARPLTAEPLENLLVFPLCQRCRWKTC